MANAEPLEPVKSDELFDALLSSAVVADTVTELPIVENAPQPAEADDIVMLIDDERDENGKLKIYILRIIH